MKIVAWLTNGTWPACVDAVAEVAPPDAEIVLLHVIDPSVTEGIHGAYAGLFGRGGRGPDPGDAVEAATRSAEAELFAAAAARLGRNVMPESRSGRPEREVVAASEDADLLVVARDGDHTRLGPHSLGRATRFVVDHAPCRVLLIWPDEPPGLDTIPPPPDHKHPHKPPKHHDPHRPR
jgi:nucleotide-binding universal stress UspA family protein